MKVSITQIRLAIVIVSVADILVFARATGITLIAMVIGTATVFLGSLYTYRQASVIGVLIIAGAAASAVEITTLKEIGEIITAGFGLVIPVFVLALVSLSAEKEEVSLMVLRRGPMVTVAAYVLVCLFSVPVAALLISLFAPGISTRLPTMTEAAILLIVTITAGMLLTWREPRTVVTKVED